MHITNRKQAGVVGWLTPAQYWASPEGKRRKELRRLDRCAPSSIGRIGPDRIQN